MPLGKESFFHHAWWAVRHGDWSWGCEQWKGKPQWGFVRTYFDGWRNAFHVGPFWIECDYLCARAARPSNPIQ